MAPGDFLMLFTDGLYEVQGMNEELYSQQRLLVDVQHLLGQPPEIIRQSAQNRPHFFQ